MVWLRADIILSNSLSNAFLQQILRSYITQRWEPRNRCFHKGIIIIEQLSNKRGTYHKLSADFNKTLSEDSTVKKYKWHFNLVNYIFTLTKKEVTVEQCTYLNVCCTKKNNELRKPEIQWN